jgi:hypothetical protein
MQSLNMNPGFNKKKEPHGGRARVYETCIVKELEKFQVKIFGFS